MQIAVTSQNRKTITPHAGKCRKFWHYQIDNNTVVEKTLIELSIEESFHASKTIPEPLADIQVLIVGGMGDGLSQRLARHNIHAVISELDDPDKAVMDYITENFTN